MLKIHFVIRCFVVTFPEYKDSFFLEHIDLWRIPVPLNRSTGWVEALRMPI